MSKLAKNSMAVGLATLIVTAGLSFSANGADKIVAQAEADAVRGTGIFKPLDGGQCTARFPKGTPAGRCGNGLDTNSIDAYSQHTAASKAGDSSADASVAPINALNLHTTLDLTELITDITKIDTGTALDGAVRGMDPVTKGLILTTFAPLVEPIDAALQTALKGLDDQLPVTLRVGAVDASASAKPGSARGSSKIVDGLNLVVDLKGQKIIVPITAGTAANSNLLIGAPQDLATGVIDGLKASLDQSLGGQLAPLNAALSAVQTNVVDALFDGLEPTVLKGLAGAVKPIISGTVNKQTPVSPTKGEIDVTGLHLVLGNGDTLDLARVRVGPNAGPNDNVIDDSGDADNDNPIVDGPGGDGPNVDTADNADNADTVDADAVADSDSQADADVSTTLPSTGAPNLMPFWLLGLGLLAFGGAVLLNERRRLGNL